MNNLLVQSAVETDAIEIDNFISQKSDWKPTCISRYGESEHRVCERNKIK